MLYKTQDGTIDSDKKIVILPNKTIVTFEEMNQYIKNAKNVNRIHKPFILLYYTDYKNGKSIEQYIIK